MKKIPSPKSLVPSWCKCFKLGTRNSGLGTDFGFTLIELMVVIAIIAILTGIIITNLVASKAKSRDAKRASDLSQISLAIEQYFDRCDQYPSIIYPSSGQTLTGINNGCPEDASGAQISLGNFISQMPTDPSSGAQYDYATSGSPPSDYILHTTFETSNSVLNQSAPEPSGYPTGWNINGTIHACNNQATIPAISNGLDYCVRPN